MAARPTPHETLPPELDAIAQAAAERLRAHATADTSALPHLHQRLTENAIAAINAGVTLNAIAEAERTGEQRARHDLAPDRIAGHQTRRRTRPRSHHRLPPSHRPRRQTRTVTPRHRHRRQPHPQHHPRHPHPHKSQHTSLNNGELQQRRTPTTLQLGPRAVVWCVQLA